MTFVLIIILFSQDLLTFNSTCTYCLLCDFVNQLPNMCFFFRLQTATRTVAIDERIPMYIRWQSHPLQMPRAQFRKLDRIAGHLKDCLFDGFFCKHNTSRMYVWYIYVHLPEKSTKCKCKYTIHGSYG